MVRYKQSSREQGAKKWENYIGRAFRNNKRLSNNPNTIGIKSCGIHCLGLSAGRILLVYRAGDRYYQWGHGCPRYYLWERRIWNWCTNTNQSRNIPTRFPTVTTYHSDPTSSNALAAGSLISFTGWKLPVFETAYRAARNFLAAALELVGEHIHDLDKPHIGQLVKAKRELSVPNHVLAVVLANKW